VRLSSPAGAQNGEGSTGSSARASPELGRCCGNWATVVQNREAAALGEDTTQACREGKRSGERYGATRGWCSPFIGVRGDHKACVKTVSNRGWVNRIFEHASVPYGPRLEPNSEACEEAAKKRKSDVGVRPFGKCAKVSGRKAMPAKASMAPKGVRTAPSKIVPAKATHTMQALKAGVVPGTSVPPRATAPSGAVVSKITVTVAATVTASRDGVLQISTGAKRLDAALSSTVKGKHAKVDARPPPASVTLMLFRCNNQLR
jgi:hypothetical protein